jgi:uncharacterized protein YuzE
MTVHIGELAFDHHRYDADADVLYLSMGEPRPGYGQETPEGHIARFDDAGEFYGVTLIGVQEMLDAGEKIRVTLPVPRRTTVQADEIVCALL